MFLRSGPDTLQLGSTHRCAGSAFLSLVEASSGPRLRKRRSPRIKGESETASPREVRRKSQQKLPYKPPVVQVQPPAQDGVGAPPSPPDTVVVPARDGSKNRSDIFSQGLSDAELGVRLFPYLQPQEASALVVGFARMATTCITYYNNNNKTNLVSKHSFSNVFHRILEDYGNRYYHLNFQAQDKDGDTKVFFAEIKDSGYFCQVEDVTCCCTVSSSDEGGKGFGSFEELKKHVYIDWDSVGLDMDHCYACTSKVKHPNGKSYIAGHSADAWQYYELPL